MLEGGLTRSASTKLHVSSIKTNLIRLLSLSFSVVIVFHDCTLNSSYHLWFQVFDYGRLFPSGTPNHFESNVCHKQKYTFFGSFLFLSYIWLRSLMQGRVWGYSGVLLHMWSDKFTRRICQGAFIPGCVVDCNSCFHLWFFWKS